MSIETELKIRKIIEKIADEIDTINTEFKGFKLYKFSNLLFCWHPLCNIFSIYVVPTMSGSNTELDLSNANNIYKNGFWNNDKAKDIIEQKMEILIERYAEF